MTRSHSTRRSSALLPLLIVAVILGACGGGGENGTGPGGGNDQSGLVINPDGLTLVVGGQGPLAATVRDSAGAIISSDGVAWISLAAPIAAVSDAGVVSGVSLGVTSVIASLNGHADTISVAVVDSIPTDSLTIEVLPHEATVNVGGTANFSAVVRNSSGAVVATPPGLIWSSTNQTVGMVVSGTAVGAAPGVTIIRASFGNITSAPAEFHVNGTTGPCDNVAMTPFWRAYIFARYSAEQTNDDNEHVVIQQSFSGKVLLQPVGGILPTFEWEGYMVDGSMAQNDRLTDLDQTPTVTETIVGEGIPVVGNGRSNFILSINEENCTYSFRFNPFNRVTHTNPNANPTTEVADLPLAVVLDQGSLYPKWYVLLHERSQDWPAHFVASLGTSSGTAVYIPFGFGQRLWSSNNTEAAMGNASIRYDLFPY